MAFASSRYDSPFSSMLTPWVKRLLIANAAVFTLMLLLDLSRQGQAEAFVVDLLALRPIKLLTHPWTLVTYAFLHGGFFHFFFNMLGLFFFGPPLEERWGSRGFIKYYLVAAAGGALFTLLGVATGLLPPGTSVLGASAAVNGVLLAYAMAWPDNLVYFWGIFPIKVKYLVAGLAVMSVLGTAGYGGAGIAHLAHLGGFVTGFVYLKSKWAPSPWGELPKRRKAKKRNALAAWAGNRRPGPSAVPSAPPPAAPPTPARNVRAERDLLDDVDSILDKISAQGLSSLTPEERARLDEVSRRYRTN